MSEFGRPIHENGNGGTDHGHATAMLVLGGPVNGGRMVGRGPGLDVARRFEGRDVAGTTEFPGLFAENLPRPPRATQFSPGLPGFTPHPRPFPRAVWG